MGLGSAQGSGCPGVRAVKSPSSHPRSGCTAGCSGSRASESLVDSHKGLSLEAMIFSRRKKGLDVVFLLCHVPNPFGVIWNVPSLLGKSDVCHFTFGR